MILKKLLLYCVGRRREEPLLKCVLENETTKVLAEFLKDFGVEEKGIDLLQTLHIACTLTESDLQAMSDELLQLEYCVPSLECTEQFLE